MAVAVLLLPNACASPCSPGFPASVAPMLANGDGFRCSSSSASDDDYNDEHFLKKLSVLLCTPQNAPQSPLRTQSYQNFGGEHAPKAP